MKRARHLSVGIRLNCDLTVWVWTWRKLALLRVTARASQSLDVLQRIEDSPNFVELLTWCDARKAKINGECLIVVPRRRLARFLRGIREIELSLGKENPAE